MTCTNQHNLSAKHCLLAPYLRKKGNWIPAFGSPDQPEWQDRTRGGVGKVATPPQTASGLHSTHSSDCIQKREVEEAIYYEAVENKVNSAQHRGLARVFGPLLVGSRLPVAFLSRGLT